MSLKRNYCHYEPIDQKIDAARVLIVNNLIEKLEDLSESAWREPGFTALTATTWLRREAEIAHRALANIESNVTQLVRHPETRIVHVSEVTEELVKEYDPDALVLSGTLRDFDLYQPYILKNFGRFIERTTYPVLGICGGHQLIGQCLGSQIVTLDGALPWEKREGRTFEYQYRFVKVVGPHDPIFTGTADPKSAVWRAHGKRGGLLCVWQNHGLMLDRLPEGFRLLAQSYLCPIQMMVKRDQGQLIYGVQFHIEKSFEDYDRRYATAWEHRNRSRDGRIIFENFLIEALKHRGPRRRPRVIASPAGDPQDFRNIEAL
jgi:GMP synthase-like glutamine amidotransferase